ncbi:hypothetical protein GBAR_LOCUS28850 [Geodia barretti]|uniref:Uncharacterized protein n=1 Tax=Geodia barretti TaxID=519541 RepID=A0AA35TRV6_GEOBA|nr:hypothetical protein GBAR_LOCUS28850 [Geodia barretti]
MSPDVVSIIRDIAIIVMAIMVAVAAVALTVVTLKIYPKVKRAATNFEASSCLMLDTAARISSLVAAGSEVGAFVWDLVTRLRGRGDDKSDDAGNSPS